MVLSIVCTYTGGLVLWGFRGFALGLIHLEGESCLSEYGSMGSMPCMLVLFWTVLVLLSCIGVMAYTCVLCLCFAVSPIRACVLVWVFDLYRLVILSVFCVYLFACLPIQGIGASCFLR